METIKLITLAQYANLPKDERAVYDLVAKSIKPTKKIWVKRKRKGFQAVKPLHPELWDFPYSAMIELKTAFISLKSLELVREIGRVVYGFGTKDFEQISYLNIAPGLFSWVFEEFEAILRAEENHLQHTPDEKEKSAGIDNLLEFEHFPAIDSLALGDITKHYEILKLPYASVFQKLAYQNTINKIQKKLIENAGK